VSVRIARRIAGGILGHVVLLVDADARSSSSLKLGIGTEENVTRAPRVVIPIVEDGPLVVGFLAAPVRVSKPRGHVAEILEVGELFLRDVVVGDRRHLSETKPRARHVELARGEPLFGRSVPLDAKLPVDLLAQNFSPRLSVTRGLGVERHAPAHKLSRIDLSFQRDARVVDGRPRRIEL
jgi:hypothetical protein